MFQTAMEDSSSEYTIPREIILTIKDKRKIFGNKHHKLKILRISDVALYSTTLPDQAEYVCLLLLLYFSPRELKQMVATDASGCIGGNTYILSKYFKKVNFIEISPLHSDIFKHNLQILYPARKNIYVYTGDYIQLYKQLGGDAIFIDPPWTGPAYTCNKKMELYYGKVSLTSLCVDLLNLQQTRLIIIKVPKNYDIHNLHNHIQKYNQQQNNRIRNADIYDPEYLEWRFICNSNYIYFDVYPMLRRNNTLIYYLIYISKVQHKPLSDNIKAHRFNSVGYKFMSFKYK